MLHSTSWVSLKCCKIITLLIILFVFFVTSHSASAQQRVTSPAEYQSDQPSLSNRSSQTEQASNNVTRAQSALILPSGASSSKTACGLNAAQDRQDCLSSPSLGKLEDTENKSGKKNLSKAERRALRQQVQDVERELHLDPQRAAR